ncbi:MAG TPA: UDP-N-acetylglucosamine 2-epimerase, partial [Candidatus Kapabacteria bacterium]|nr:UDP-N-acetylglucosamine 2-epimerase [Candidatus Kapabacteria bacterium]
FLAPNIYDLAWRRKINYDSYQWVEDINLLQNYLINKISQKSIDKIISTHALPSILSVGLKKKNIIKQAYSVITDFGTHSFWPASGIDKYFVSNDELKNTLIYRGIKENTISVTGIPIKDNLISKNRIKPIEKKIKLLMVLGAMRSGGYIHIKQYLKDIIKGIKENHKYFELTIVTGHHKEIKKDVLKICKGIKLDVKILGYVKKMASLMARHDVLITKPGGLIISEALSIGLCIVLLKPGPGQEIANTEFLARNGIALNGENAEQFNFSLNYLIKNPKMIESYKAKSKKFGFVNSSKRICELVFKELTA